MQCATATPTPTATPSPIAIDAAARLRRMHPARARRSGLASARNCRKTEVHTVDAVKVWTVDVFVEDGVQPFLFESGMTIDADGAPNAYGPPGTSPLDDLSSAGWPGHWWGLVTDNNGNPIVQGDDDPAPGYYVSTTALVDRSKAPENPRRYVDATEIPYIALPKSVQRALPALQLSDFAIVLNGGESSGAFFADIGPEGKLGEGSIELAQELGIDSDARTGGTKQGVVYLVFAGSGSCFLRSVEKIQAEAERLFNEFGGLEQLNACLSTEDLTRLDWKVWEAQCRPMGACRRESVQGQLKLSATLRTGDDYAELFLYLPDVSLPSLHRNSDGTYNLVGKRLEADVRSTADFMGDPRHPNGVQFLLKDRHWKNLISPWWNVTEELESSGMHVAYVVPGGNDIAGNVAGISIKFGVGSGCATNCAYNGEFIVDNILLK